MWMVSHRIHAANPPEGAAHHVGHRGVPSDDRQHPRIPVGEGAERPAGEGGECVLGGPAPLLDGHLRHLRKRPAVRVLQKPVRVRERAALGVPRPRILDGATTA